MNPAPGAGTSARRTSGHLGGNFELGETFPNGSVVYSEDDEVLGLDGLGLGSGCVGDGEYGSFDVVDVLRVEFEGVVTRADVVSLTDVTAE
jgi:hypothetical protein